MPTDSMTTLWIALLVIGCIAEGLTAGLVSIWFVQGALAALLVSFMGGGLLLQLVVFVVITLATMLLLRPLAKRFFTPKHQATNADRIIGQTAVVIVPIDPVNGTGQVKVDGKIWTARAMNGQPIPLGTQVLVRQIQGVKVLVEIVP